MLCARMPHVEWEEALCYDISSDFPILCNRMQSFALFVSHILHSLYTLGTVVKFRHYESIGRLSR